MELQCANISLTCTLQTHYQGIPNYSSSKWFSKDPMQQNLKQSSIFFITIVIYFHQIILSLSMLVQVRSSSYGLLKGRYMVHLYE
jgi:hypothetical protein